ncbi:MAG: lysophospholipase [Acidisphaera sp.]|nr:lysophospholipase [Acidisphaera sp.]
MRRRAFMTLAAATLTAACVGPMPPLLRMGPAGPTDGSFVMRDGARLPYRIWQPDQEPWAVVLALHGFNDSRDAWELPAPSFTRAGVAIVAPDQRGFGHAPDRGRWAGTQALVDDAAEMAGMLRRRYPSARLYLMGESMGGAVLMRLATQPEAPPVDGYVLLAPAVWGRAEMNVLLRSLLWVASNVAPGLSLSGGPVRVVASSNRAALIRLSTDPLTLHSTRVDTLKGLVDLMDAALAAAPHFRAPSLFLYGGKDELVPGRATAATWRGLEEAAASGTRIAYYPAGYHLLLRDLDRAAPIGDVIAWMHTPGQPLPSGADRAAAEWLARQR